MEKLTGIREKALKKARDLRGRLGSVRNEPADGGTDTGSAELDRTRRELRKARRELTRRNRKLAELRASVREAESHPVSTAASTGQEGTAPFFILGPPKSGTSWVQGALGSHPEIFCAGEGKFFGRDLKTDNPYGQWGADFSAAMTGLGYRTADRASLYSAIMDSKDLNG